MARKAPEYKCIRTTYNTNEREVEAAYTAVILISRDIKRNIEARSANDKA